MLGVIYFLNQLGRGEVGTGYYGYVSPTGKSALRKLLHNYAMSASEKTHTTVYSHKSMLNDSTHIECAVHSMRFRL